MKMTSKIKTTSKKKMNKEVKIKEYYAKNSINHIKGDVSDSELNAGGGIIATLWKLMKERRKTPYCLKLFWNL